ncbi:MAG: redox-regulated ATPase YchF [Bacilli bacterium]|nr:redox-regulated ATPase YchF [Bacilli bacterium]
MSLTAGIVGLPNVGKSTLFNAITKNQILTANYPFATIDPNLGIVTVPDKRLDKLNKIYNPIEVIPTTFEFTDIAGLVKGASLGEGLGNKFLSHIREVDAICHVVRCFVDDSIIHVEKDVNPTRDIEIINLELILSDLEIIDNRIEKLAKKAATKEKTAILEYNTLLKAKLNLEKNIPLRRVTYTNEEYKVMKSFNFLTLKPMIYVANISEEKIKEEDDKYINIVKKYAIEDNAEVVVISAKIESELSELEEEDKRLYLNEIGLIESGLDQLIKATYSLLELQTFFTAGPKEVRAWTFKKGMTAKECAGIIHSDFERGFIRMETISYEDILKYGSEKEVKENGRMRLEGKEYKLRDGDICHFRFNVT